MPTAMKSQKNWGELLEIFHKKCSKVEFANWIEPIRFISLDDKCLILQVPNIFVKEYLLDNYSEVLALVAPLTDKQKPIVNFKIEEKKSTKKPSKKTKKSDQLQINSPLIHGVNLNEYYIFNNYIEGPSNQFLKSAALGVAQNPGKSYNPLFIHGGGLA